MASNSTRLWTLPLTALLFVNTVLVGLATRHVGFAGEPEPAVAVVPAPIEDEQAQPVVLPVDAPIVEPTVPTPEVPVVEGTLTIWDEVIDFAPDWYAGIEPGDFSAICPIAAPLLGDATTQSPALSSVAPQASLSPEPTTMLVEPAVTSTSPSDPAEAQPNECRDFLVVVNPPNSGGVVHFLLDGEVISLAPGELHRLPAKEELRVQFHRGDDFGDADHRCPCGVFAFAIGAEGWKLDGVEDQFAARLLKVCRPVATVRYQDGD